MNTRIYYLVRHDDIHGPKIGLVRPKTLAQAIDQANVFRKHYPNDTYVVTKVIEEVVDELQGTTPTNT